MRLRRQGPCTFAGTGPVIEFETNWRNNFVEVFFCRRSRFRSGSRRIVPGTTAKPELERQLTSPMRSSRPGSDQNCEFRTYCGRYFPIPSVRPPGAGISGSAVTELNEESAVTVPDSKPTYGSLLNPHGV